MQSVEDKLSRLRAMIEDNQQTWDLSKKDVEAIRMAVDVLEVIVDADTLHNGDLEMFDVDSEETPKMLCVGGTEEYYGETAFDCFVHAAEILRELKGTST